MCQATIPLRVKYRLPFSHRRRRRHDGAAEGDPQAAEQQQQEGGAAAAAGAEGIPGLAVLVAQLQVGCVGRLHAAARRGMGFNCHGRTVSGPLGKTVGAARCAYRHTLSTIVAGRLPRPL